MNDQTALVPLAETMQLGEVLAKSGFFEDSRQAAQAVVKVLAGREIGVGPIASMVGIHIIQGKPALGANLIASAIKRTGRYNYRIRKHDASICEIEFFERMGDKWESVGVSFFTIDEAKKAGTKNLDKFPKNMLFARAMSNGARWFTPDIFGGAPVYTPEELGANVNEDGEVIDVTPTRVTTSTPPAQEAPTNGNGAERPPHWIDDAETRKRFWVFVSKQGISENDLKAALGTDKVHDFTGTPQDAKTRIEAFVAQRQPA